MDLLDAMRSDGASIAGVRVDGGMVNNNWLTQTLADILDVEVSRPEQTETTALGAAYLAGLQCGVYSSLDDLTQNWQLDRSFSPKLNKDRRNSMIAGWESAIARTRSDYKS